MSNTGIGEGYGAGGSRKPARSVSATIRPSEVRRARARSRSCRWISSGSETVMRFTASSSHRVWTRAARADARGAPAIPSAERREHRVPDGPGTRRPPEVRRPRLPGQRHPHRGLDRPGLLGEPER